MHALPGLGCFAVEVLLRFSLLIVADLMHVSRDPRQLHVDGNPVVRILYPIVQVVLYSFVQRSDVT
jgi:hypothetical protein